MTSEAAGSERQSDAFECWRATLAGIGVSVEHADEASPLLRSELVRRDSPVLSQMTFDVDRLRIARQPAQIRQVEWGQYLIYRELSPGCWFDYAGQEFVTGRGDLIVADADAPFRTLAKARYHHQAWVLPRIALEPHLPRGGGPLMVHIPARTGVWGLIDAYLQALDGQFDILAGPQGPSVADNLGRLIAVACGGSAPEHRDALREGRLDRVRQYVDRHLASPDLTPARVASAVGMSLRQLHLVFEPSGESFGEYVRRRRLNECRAALQNPMSAGRSVTDIAFAWGFSSLPSFYRAFSAAFGMAPGDIRARAMSERMSA